MASGEIVDSDINIYNLFLFKLESFLNIRIKDRSFKNLYYIEDECYLYDLAAKKSTGGYVYLTRWHDLFSNEVIKDKLIAQGFTESDFYACTITLSRLSYLFQIDNRQRTTKHYFIFFYLIQLVRLKNVAIKNNDTIRNYMLRFLFFELSMDYEDYIRFSIQKNHLMFTTDNIGKVDFNEVVDQIYNIIKINNRKEKVLLLTIKKFQQLVIDFLVKADDYLKFINLDDYNNDLIYSDIFLDMFKKDQKKLFNALIETVDNRQSTSNLFISELILMNYSFFILKDNPKHILKLKKYINDECIFKKLLTTLLHRKMCINAKSFEGLGLDEYLNSMTTVNQ